MRTFKTIDLIGQLLLILGFTVAWLRVRDFETPIIGYFVVGAWQLVSMVVHWAVRYDMWRWSHRALHTAFMCVLPLAVLFYFLNPDTGIALLLILYFASPALALWYWLLCYQEWKRMRRQPDTAESPKTGDPGGI